MNENQPTRRDYTHVKILALIAIVASQIPILTSLPRRHARIVELEAERRKAFPLVVGEQLYDTLGCNPIDGMKTNFSVISVVSNGWVKIQYPDYAITLHSDAVEQCYEPVSRLKR